MNWANSSAWSQCKCIRQCGRGCPCAARECLHGESQAWTVRIWSLLPASPLLLSRVYSSLFRGVNSLHGVSSQPGVLAPSWGINVPLMMSFSFEVLGHCNRCGHQTLMNWRKSRLESSFKPRTGLSFRKTVERVASKTFSTWTKYCRESLNLHHTSNLILSPFYRRGSQGTERLSHFSRVTQDVVADLGFTPREPDSRVHVKIAKCPVCGFTIWRRHSQDFSLKVSAIRAHSFTEWLRTWPS